MDPEVEFITIECSSQLILGGKLRWGVDIVNVLDFCQISVIKVANPKPNPIGNCRVLKHTVSCFKLEIVVPIPNSRASVLLHIHIIVQGVHLFEGEFHLVNT